MPEDDRGCQLLGARAWADHTEIFGVGCEGGLQGFAKVDGVAAAIAAVAGWLRGRLGNCRRGEQQGVRSAVLPAPTFCGVLMVAP